MRALLFIIIIFVSAALFINDKAPETFSCVRPIHYSVGRFDQEFDISKETFLSLLSETEAVWEGEAEKELFVYDEKGAFTINLIYDERQQKTELVEATEEELDQKQEGYEEADALYRSLVAEYENRTTAFESELAAYKLMAEEYERDVAEWNASGKRDASERSRLEELGRELKEIYSNLETEEAELKSLYADLESALAERNALVADYNREVNNFNEEFAGAESFDQGDYSRGQINVYQFKNAEDLKLVLAHEFGHALGIDHVEDPAAIMHFLLSEQSTNPIELTSDDKAAFDSRCAIF
jgi:DNA repair exonuclease SbcCD ATPase subunit